MEKHQKGCRLYYLNPMPNTSSVAAGFNLLLILLFHVHELSYFFSCLRQAYPDVPNILRQYTIDVLIPRELAPICYSISGLLTLLIVLVIFFNQDGQEGFKYILGYIGSRLFPLMRLLTQLNVLVSAYFMTVDKICGGLFAITCLLNLFVNFFQQNYAIRKDYLCCRNVDYLILLKTTIFIGYANNVIGVLYCSEILFMVTLFIHLILSTTLFFVYFFRGITIYEHNITRNLVMFLLILYISMVFSQVCDQILRITKTTTETHCLLFLADFFVLFSILAYSFFRYVRQQSLGNQKSRLNFKVYFIGDKINSFSNSIEDECEMRGIVKCHIDENCENPDCFTIHEEVYDSKSNKVCQLSKINQNKETFLKLYVKCLYEKSLAEDNLSTKIDYTEFNYYILKNTYKTLKLVEECERKFQFPYDRIRLARLKKCMLQDNKRLNKQLYEGNLDIECVIESEKIFQELKKKLTEVLKRNLQYWQHVHRNKIDLTELIDIVKPNFTSMESINEGWKELAKYFQIQKKWKFYYAWFILFVKNEKLKPVILEYFGTEVHEDELFGNETRDYDRTSEKTELKSSKIIFQNTSAVVHTNSNAEKPCIKRVNNHFQRLFGYTEAEIIDAPISILMPESITKFHKQLFEQWVISGKSSSQPNYHIKKVYARHKSGHLFCVYKYLKQLICADGQLQFVTMFKSCKEDEPMLMMDDNYHIEGLTCSLYSKLGLQKIAHEQSALPAINFLLLCPKFLKYSKYKDMVSPEDQHFFGIERDKTRQKTSQMEKEKSKLKQEITNLQLDLEIKPLQKTKPSTQGETEHYKMTIRIPEDMSELLQVYETETKNANNSSDQYRAIKKAFLFSKNCRNVSRFNCQIDVNTRRFGEVTFYQVFTREIYSLEARHEEIVIHDKKTRKQNSFMPQDFHKFFDSSQENRAYSLAFSNNIFIKEDNNKPIERLSHIDGLSFFMRMFFLCFFTLILFTFLFNFFININGFLTSGQKLSQITLLDLNMPYYECKVMTASFLNEPSNAAMRIKMMNSTVEIVNSTYETLRKLKNSGNVKKTIFDESINPTKIYSSPYEPDVYDEVDVVYKTLQVTETLTYLGLDNYTLKSISGRYLDRYLVPCFSKVTQKCTQNLNQSFLDILQVVKKITITMYVIEGLAVGIGFLLALYNTRKITSSFIAVMEVFTQFSQTDVIKIYKYSHCLLKLFRHMGNKDLEQRSPQRETLEEENIASNSHFSFAANYYESDSGNNNININKKIKKVEVGSVLNKLRFKTFVYFIVFLSLFAGSSFYMNTFIKEKIESINSLAVEGSTTFSTYSLLTKALIAIKKKFANSTRYEQELRVYFQPEIDRLLQLRNISARVSTRQDFQFVKHYNNMFFADICSIYESKLPKGSNVSRCQAVSQSSLQHGIQSYIYYFTSVSNDFLTTSSTSMTFGDVVNLQQGLYYINIFLQALSEMWNDEYENKVADVQNNLVTYAVCVLSGYLVIYFFMIQILIIGNLYSNYDFFRKVYEMYMPDFVVSKEKIIKAKLIVEGILNK